MKKIISSNSSELSNSTDIIFDNKTILLKDPSEIKNAPILLKVLLTSNSQSSIVRLFGKSEFNFSISNTCPKNLIYLNGKSSSTYSKNVDFLSY